MTSQAMIDAAKAELSRRQVEAAKVELERRRGANKPLNDMEALALAAAAKKRKSADMSFAGRLRDNLIGVDDGQYSFGERAADLLNKGGEGLTFGVVGDEAAAAGDALIGRGSYDERLQARREQEAHAETQMPLAMLGAEVAGGVAAPLSAFGALWKGAGIIPRIAASAGATGVLGGLHGFAEGEGGAEQRFDSGLNGTLAGAGIGAAIPFAGVGVQKLADGMVARRAIRQAAKDAPTTEELRRLGGEAYDAVDAAGVRIKPGAFDRARRRIAETLVDQGLDTMPGTGLTPQSARLVENMGEMSAELADEGASLPFKQLDQLRRRAGVPASNMNNKVESALGSEAISQLDSFVEKLAPEDVTAGDLNALKTMIPKAREIWSRMSKSQIVDDAIENSGGYLSGSASGIRNQFKRIVKNPKLRRGFPEAEKKMLRRAAQGTLPEQLLHLAAGGLGNILTISGGAAAGGVPGALAGGAAAAGLRTAAGHVANRNAEMARALVAVGGLKALPKASPEVRKVAEVMLQRGIAVSQ